MLIGREAPIVLGSVRSSHFEDAYDFYKPNLSSEYPTVFGQESNVCYLRALDGCYRRFADKWEAVNRKKLTLDEWNHVVLHSPYNKLVKKSGARMMYNDFIRDHNLPLFKKHAAELSKFLHLMPEETYNDRELEKSFTELARPMYKDKVHVPASGSLTSRISVCRPTTFIHVIPSTLPTPIPLMCFSSSLHGSHTCEDTNMQTHKQTSKHT
jgi:hydroxymethylglutaryl-CoA synthase